MDNYMYRAQDLHYLKNPSIWREESLFVKRKINDSYQLGTIHKDNILRVYFRVSFNSPFWMEYKSAEEILDDKWELNGYDS